MGEIHEVRGCCPLDCQDSCSWVATVEDGRVVGMAGAKEHPVTRGSLCAKVNDYHERPYAPDRLVRPLRRVGPKGSGTFEPISWEAAIDEVAVRFRRVVDEHGAEALLPFHYLGSMGVVQRRALHRIFHVLGASRFHGSVCGQAGNAIAAEGFPTGMDPEEMSHARFVLVWGANPLTTSHHTWHFLAEARRRHGARIVCIDPRVTRTSKASDEHVRVMPGTDWALAAGMGRVILDEGLADLDHARQVATDLDAYAAMVDPWTPDRVAETCGIDASVVARLAREYAEARPGLIRLSVGVQQTANGEALVRALYALPILAGHWQHRGGGHFCETVPVMDEAAAARPDLLPGSVRSLDMARLGESLTDPELDPPIKALMVWTANPAVSQPDSGRVRRGLAREDLFTVVVEHFLTDTARYADVVLPSTTQLEHFDVQGAWGHHYISLNNPAIAPVGQTKSHGEIMRLLAARMGLDHPALRESDEDIAASALPPGLSLDELRSGGWYKSPPAPFTATASGGALRISGPAPSLPAPPGDGLLRLLTPKSHHFMNSTFANMPRQRKAMRRPTLDMHPDDAGSRGLVDGDHVEVNNGSVTVRGWLRTTDDVRPGVVAMAGKWWGAPDDDSAVANLLSSSAWSPGGQPTYNDTWVLVAGAAPSTPVAG
ncbi:MAG: molybdopterin-dependent oxidoreductase [Actinobacteria bacterium]|nr:molybdopterin-dependent oxidoreductase [Actinomycetota bacterium]